MVAVSLEIVVVARVEVPVAKRLVAKRLARVSPPVEDAFTNESLPVVVALVVLMFVE
jgi:hypothetical protein